MDVVARAGLIADGTRIDLLTNQLAVIVPDDRPRTLSGIRDLLDPSIKRIALGDPAAVPAGVYAKQYLEKEGIWGDLESRVVPTGSVRAALAAVETGAADAAIVYRTDALVAKRAKVAWLVPVDRGPRIIYPAAVIARSTSRPRRNGSSTSCGATPGRGSSRASGSRRRGDSVDVWRITWFTIASATAATALMLPAGVAIAWLLARYRFRGRSIVETAVSLPLVLPPVATGLILLTLLSRRGVVGRLLADIGIDVVFTWKAVVIAMATMGMPLLVRTARAGFEQVDQRYERVAATLGASPARIFFTISLPLAAPSVIAGAVLAFARALGEFGATIMVAGSIPGVTRTLAVAIYSYTETGQDSSAAVLLVVSAVIACVALWIANRLTERRPA